MYEDFISYMNEIDHDLEKTLNSNVRLMGLAKEKIDHLKKGEKEEKLSYEAILIQNQLLMLEIEELKKKIGN